MIIIARRGGFPESESNAIAIFYFRRNLRIRGVSIFRNLMSWRKFILPYCIVASLFAPTIGKAQMTAQSNSSSQIRAHRTLIPLSVRMPMHRAPVMNSALGLRRLNHFNHADFNRAHRFHRFKHFNQIIFIGNFASRWWWTPWWAWNWVYPYGSSLYFYPSDYSAARYAYDNYSYGNASSGYDYGYVYPPLRYYDYTNDDEGAVRNLLAEYEVSWNGDDPAVLGRLFTEDCDYVNTVGVHWKGVQEIVQGHAKLFQKRSKTAVRKLTDVEVSFSAPDVAVVHARWDVTGSSRLAREAVPVLKENTTITMGKTSGKWLITSFQNTESSNE